ncbi:Gfo/Idh/MocA family protein [Brassicibacter mesophilus]|uniref:Gfo/Idh/MocA family protein n=1 Tax=Brassicibacter mesophilus TaxID=745119 RepID=UPI003D1F9D84
MDKIKVGLIGYGYIGKIHSIGYLNIPLVLQDPQVKIEMTKVIRRKNSLGEDSCWLARGDDIDELTNEDINLVDICTPNDLHMPQIEILAKKGINIYCEKPLGLNYQQCAKMADIVGLEGIINQVALVYRFMPALAKARGFLLENKLGDVINFRAHLLHGSYLNPRRPITWRLQKNRSGGGALIDLGIHLADCIRFLLGEVRNVKAETKTIFDTRPNDNGEETLVDVDDWGLINLEMMNGAKGTMEVSKVSINPLEAFNIEIYGTKGFIKVTDKGFYEPNIYLFNENNVLEKVTIEKLDPYSQYLSTIIPSPKMSLGNMVDMHLASQMNVLNNIINGRVMFRETPTFEEASKSQKIVDIAYLSN